MLNTACVCSVNMSSEVQPRPDDSPNTSGGSSDAEQREAAPPEQPGPEQRDQTQPKKKEAKISSKTAAKLSTSAKRYICWTLSVVYCLVLQVVVWHFFAFLFCDNESLLCCFFTFLQMSNTICQSNTVEPLVFSASGLILKPFIKRHLLVASPVLGFIAYVFSH